MAESHHFDSIIMDDIIQVTPNDPKMKEHAKAIEKMLWWGQTTWQQKRDVGLELVKELLEEINAY